MNEQRMSTLAQPAPYALRGERHHFEVDALTTHPNNSGHGLPDAEAAQLVADFEKWAKQPSRSVLFQCVFKSAEGIRRVFLDDYPVSPGTTERAVGGFGMAEAEDQEYIATEDEQGEDDQDEDEDADYIKDDSGEDDEGDRTDQDINGKNDFAIESPLFSLNASEVAADSFETVLCEFARRHVTTNTTVGADQQLPNGEEVREDSFDAEEMFGAGAGVYESDDADDSCLDDESEADEMESKGASGAAGSPNAPLPRGKPGGSHAGDCGHEKNGSSFFSGEVPLYVPHQKRLSKASAP